ncbi:MAG: small basic family protein [bacterium]
MWIPLIGLIIGLIVGILFPFSIPLIKTKYLAISTLSAIDSVFIGFRTRLNNNFNVKLFVTEFILNTILAIGLVYLGDIMNTDLFVTITIVFSAKIFYNISNLNHQLFFKNKSIVLVKDKK